MILGPGQKVHVIYRRRYEDDARRHFIGEVLANTEVLARLMGYVFLYDSQKKIFLKQPDRREQILPLCDSGIIITLLPGQVSIDRINYEITLDKRLCLTDAEGFRLVLS